MSGDMDKEKEVKRYTQAVVQAVYDSQEPHGRAVKMFPLIEAIDGEWVEYSDWQAERTKREEAEAKVKDLESKLSGYKNEK